MRRATPLLFRAGLRSALLAALLPALFCGAAAGQERTLARDFLEAYRAKNAAKEAILASRPTADVAYAVVVDALLREDAVDAAQSLAKLRAGAPEGPGLQRIIDSYRAGRRASVTVEETCREAEARLRKGDAKGALDLLSRADAVPGGTVLAASAARLRAQALTAAGKKDDALAAWRETIRCAREVGWPALASGAAREATALALSLNRTQEARDTLKEYAAAAAELDDTDTILRALQARAKLSLQLGDSQEARKDLATARELAEKSGKPILAARLASNIGYVFLTVDRMPHRALIFFRKALEEFRQQKSERDVQQLLLDVAIAATQVARYSNALSSLDELLAAKDAPAALAVRARRQRAYVLFRLGRTESAQGAFREALAETPAGAERRTLLTQFGELELERGDSDAAGKAFAAVLEAAPETSAALSGRATIHARRGERAAARADLVAARKCTGSDAFRARLWLQEAVLDEGWGDLKGGLAAAREALSILKKNPKLDPGNAAVAWLLVGDLQLRAGDEEKAADAILNGATLFFRLREPAHAVPGYVRCALLLRRLKRYEEAVDRLSQAKSLAKAAKDSGLASWAALAEAMVKADVNRSDEAEKEMDQARRLAKASGRPGRLATVLCQLALFQPEKAAALAERARSLRDEAESADGPPAQHPFLQGEDASWAESIALAALLRKPDDAKAPATALALLEGGRARRLLAALGGRVPVLERLLPHALYDEFVRARGALREAEATGKGESEAEAALQAFRVKLRAGFPAVAAVAYPRSPTLAEIQGALRKDEALLLMCDDPYARGVLAITRRRALLRPFEEKDPLGPVSGLLEGVKDLLVAADGVWATIPFATVRYGKAPLFDRFHVFEVLSAADFLRLRRGAAAPANGIAVWGKRAPGLPEEAVPEDSPPSKALSFLHVGAPLLLDFNEPRACGVESPSGFFGTLRLLQLPPGPRTVVAPEARIRRCASPRPEGLFALVETLRLRGAETVVLPLLPDVPASDVSHLYGVVFGEGVDLPTALRETESWARKAPAGKPPRPWTGLVCFGVPR